MSSAAEAELGALYINCREAIPAGHALIAMEHPQPAKPMQTNNTTALGVINKTIAQRRTKAMDMRFKCLRYRAHHLQFRHYLRLGSTNKDDNVTKYHAAIHHKMMHSQLLTPKRTLNILHHRAYALLTRSTTRVF